jgi:uncharacterized protein HemX
MQFIQAFLTNKLLAAILAALVLGFGGVFLHWQQEANEKEQAHQQALQEANDHIDASFERTRAQMKADYQRYKQSQKQSQ